MGFEVTPKRLILGLLQATKSSTMPIKVITEAGILFGYSSNAMRVNVARLVAASALESDERGYYQMTNKSSPVSQHINNWSRGEKNRQKKWRGDWLACLPGNATSKKSLNASLRALGYLGFSSAALQGQSSPLWVRPNNLALSRSALQQLLQHLGLDACATIFVASEFDDDVEDQWRSLLWPIKKLEKQYQLALKKIAYSQKRLIKLPIDQALVESFIVGSEVINVIVTDPLLPDEFMDPSLRLALTSVMLAYDKLGQGIWAERFQDYDVEISPIHLSLVKGEIG